MRFIIYAAIFLIAFSINAQKGTKLYKDLKEGLPISLARKIVKNNKADYNSINFGNGFIWTIKARELYERENGDNYFYGILMYPKNSLMYGSGYDGTRNYLDHAETFFVERGYTDLIRNDYWNAPANFTANDYAYGLVMENKKDNRVVHLYPAESPAGNGNYTMNAYIQIWSKEAWDTLWSKRENKKESDTKDTDF